MGQPVAPSLSVLLLPPPRVIVSVKLKVANEKVDERRYGCIVGWAWAD